jgi:5,5'-dehydrodivanillate O-demethylase
VQDVIPSWVSPITDPKTGRWISSHVINQDIIAWAGQGRITDRTKENLGASDRGIAMVRRQLFMDIDAVAAGQDPKGVIRDPEKNVAVQLPNASRKLLLDGLPLAEYTAHPVWGKHLTQFPFHYGQPDEVKRAYEKAMGIQVDGSDIKAVHI